MSFIRRELESPEKLSLELVPNPELLEPTQLQTEVCANVVQACPQMNASLPALKHGESFVTQRFSKMGVQQLAGLMEDHNLCLRATKSDLSTTRTAMFTAAQLRSGQREMTSQVPMGGGEMSLCTRGGGQYISYLKYT